MFDQARVDVAMHHFIDDADAFFAGVAQAIDEARLNLPFFHFGGNRFSTAVDDDWAHASRCHEGDVLEHGLGDFGVFHGAAAKFDQDDGVGEILDVRQGFNEDRGFGDEVLHGWHVDVLIRKDGEGNQPFNVY